LQAAKDNQTRSLRSASNFASHAHMAATACFKA
jgi:hypothetical protein